MSFFSNEPESVADGFHCSRCWLPLGVTAWKQVVDDVPRLICDECLPGDQVRRFFPTYEALAVGQSLRAINPVTGASFAIERVGVV